MLTKLREAVEVEVLTTDVVGGTLMPAKGWRWDREAHIKFHLWSKSKQPLHFPLELCIQALLV